METRHRAFECHESLIHRSVTRHLGRFLYSLSPPVAFALELALQTGKELAND
ncbi:MAG: hypothetical protein ACI8PT_001356, partial [Gammaproteobacteria bacterium]